jgi:hypothetical protein
VVFKLEGEVKSFFSTIIKVKLDVRFNWDVKAGYFQTIKLLLKVYLDERDSASCDNCESLLGRVK